MKRLAWSLAALLSLAPAAIAQEGTPPAGGEKPAAAPAKHENKVTEAAKAAFEAWEKMMASPVAQGLKDFSGTIEMKMEMPGGGGREVKGMPSMGMSFSVVFKAPKDLTVGARGGEMFPRQAAEGMKQGVASIVLNALGLYVPAGDEEFDADVVTENGKKVLVLTHFSKGVHTGSMRMTLDETGLPSFGTVTVKDGSTPVEQKMKLSWVFAKDGDLHRLEKQIVETPMGNVEYQVSYADAGGFRMPTKFMTSMGGMKSGYRFTELTVNGKTVNLSRRRQVFSS